MSSMRSASSSTTYSTWFSTQFLASMWSSRRPGVATSTSTPRFSSSVCGFMSMPPNTTATRSFGVLGVALDVAAATWSASSRVGAAPARAPDGAPATCWRSRACSIRCSSGSEKAAVLPVPVCAAPMTSRPASTTGIAFAWIGVIAR